MLTNPTKEKSNEEKQEHTMNTRNRSKTEVLSTGGALRQK